MTAPKRKYVRRSDPIFQNPAIESVLQKMDGYRGSHDLKRPGQSIAWTKELMLEHARCAADPIYFGERYMKVVDLNEGLVQIKMYDYQKKIVKYVWKHNAVVAECARQSGKTTAMTIIILWFVLFHAYKSVAILANKGDVAREILSRIKLAYTFIPDWMQHGVIEWNKGNIELENGSKIMAAGTASDSVRGFSCNMLFLDEAAHIENWDEFFRSVYPIISQGKDSKLVLVSTVKGMNHFHRITTLARQGKNNYKLISVKWSDVPGRDEAWRQKILEETNFDYELFAQEYENEYIGSSNTLISGTKLKELVEGVEIPTLDNNAGLKMYHEYDPKHTYCIVADVARGKGLDYSAFQLIDITKMPYVQTLVFRDNMATPAEFAEIISRFGRAYGHCTVMIEVNDIGQQVAELMLYDFEYENLIFTDNKGPRGKIATQGYSPNTDKGVRTTKLVKNIGCSMLKLIIENNQLIINDQDTISELTTFSRRGPSYEAETGKHDDLVMCLVLFAWLTEQQLFKMLTDIHTLMTMREKTDEQITSELSGFGFINRRMVDDDIHDALELDKMRDERWFVVEENVEIFF